MCESYFLLHLLTLSLWSQNGVSICGEDTEIWFVGANTQHALRPMVGAGEFLVASRLHENLREATVTPFMFDILPLIS